jgi:hypothetical protein
LGDIAIRGIRRERMRSAMNGRHALALIVGTLIGFVGLMFTIMVCAGGIWGIAHAWPILLFTVPMAAAGSVLVVRAKKIGEWTRR